MTPLEKRFWAKVIKTDGCWFWMGRLAKGYGRFRIKPHPFACDMAHRVSYELLVGPIPEGLSIDHLCKNKACVNPDHLEPVTLQENTRRANQKVLCHRGHVLAQSAIYWPNGKGRQCRECAHINYVNRRDKARAST